MGKRSRLAAAVCEVAESVGSDPSEFVRLMGHEHRTHQQDFTRLCFAWIAWMAACTPRELDGRNTASQELCSYTIDKIAEDGLYCPTNKGIKLPRI